jgi:hypothetical protein
MHVEVLDNQLLICCALTWLLRRAHDLKFMPETAAHQCLDESLNFVPCPLGRSEELQEAAASADAVRLLAGSLAETSSSGQRRQGTLHALGMLCMGRDEWRRQLVDARVRHTT